MPALLILFFLYMWSSRLGTDGYELEYLLSAGNLIRNGSMTLPPEPTGVPGVAERAPGTLHLPRHNLLQVLLTVPFYLAGMPFNHLFTPLESGLLALPMGSLLAVSLLNPLLTLAAVILIFRIGCELGYPEPGSRQAATIYGVATMAWPYAAIGMEPLQVAAMLTAFLFYIRLQHHETLRETILLALSITALMHTKISAPLLALPVAAAGSLLLLRRRRICTMLTYFAILGASALVWYLLYEFRRRGVYGPGFFENFKPGLVPRNIIGFVISPGKSLFVYSPILLWCLPGISGFFVRHRSFAVVMTATSAACLLLTACWDWSLIEDCWGPRYLMPIVPVLIIMGFKCFRPEPIRCSRRSHFTYTALLVVSVLVQIPGVLYPNVCILRSAQNEDVSIIDLTTWVPDLSPIWVGWRMVGQKINESLGFPPEPMLWHHYRGLVGLKTKPAVAEFDTREFNRPYTAPFLLVRNLQMMHQGTGSVAADPDWLLAIWMAVTLGCGFMVIVSLGKGT